MSVRAAFIAGGVSAARARTEAPLAEAAMRERDITSQARAEAFIAQVLHESMRLRYFEEIASGAAYDITVNPTIARGLGNIHPGDGRRYKGRGPIQLTGRANYRWAGKELRLPLEAHPELAAQHAIGWRIAALYWSARGLNALADRHDFESITRWINGGLNGYESRRHFLALVQRVDCRPVDRWEGYTASEKRWIREYDHLKAQGRDLARRRVLVRVMGEQRKRVWRAAQARAKGGDGKGWSHANRRARYESLLARTT